MPPDVVTGRDIKLIAVGMLCLLAGGAWATTFDGWENVLPLGIFGLLAVLSFWVAWWDIRSRRDLSFSGRD